MLKNKSTEQKSSSCRNEVTVCSTFKYEWFMLLEALCR